MSDDAGAPLKSRRTWLRSTLDIVSTLALIALAASVAWSTFINSGKPAARRPVEVPKSPVAIAGSPTLGSQSAPVVLIGFSDFQCPFCGQFAREILPLIRRDFIDSQRVAFVFKHFPIKSLHNRAEAAAEAAQCAAEQGAFWQIHDLLFTAPPQLADDDLIGAAAKSRIDLAVFRKCLVGPSSGEVVKSDVALADGLQIRGTPTFMVGKRKGPGEVAVSAVLSGVTDYAAFKKVLEPLVR